MAGSFEAGAPFSFMDGVVLSKTAQCGAGGGNLYATLTPAANGELWIPIAVLGYHDDVAARAAYWAWWDGTTEARLSFTAALTGSTVGESLFNMVGCIRPVVIGYGTELRWHIDGLTAGKLAYIRAAVAVIRGVEPWNVI